MATIFRKDLVAPLEQVLGLYIYIYICFFRVLREKRKTRYHLSENPVRLVSSRSLPPPMPPPCSQEAGAGDGEDPLVDVGLLFRNAFFSFS